MNNSFLRPDDVPLPVEGLKQVENAEQVEAQNLDDTTFQPGAFIEHSGGFQEAEALQNSLAVVMDTSANLSVEIQVMGAAAEIASSPVPQPIPDIAEEISAQPVVQIQDVPGPTPSPGGEGPASNGMEAAAIGSIHAGAAEGAPPPAGELHEVDPSQLREVVDAGDLPQPGAAAETFENSLRITEPSAVTGILVNNTLSGLVEEKAFNETYQVRMDLPVQAGLYNAAVSILGGDLRLPEVERMITPEGGEIPPAPEAESQEGTTPAAGEGQAETMPAAAEGQVETTEPSGETGETWVPPEMYISFGADGKMTIVDASGKPIDSPPIILNPLDPPPYYAYYPGLVDKNGDTIKFEINSFKGTDVEVFYYVNPEGQIIAVDAYGKPLDSPPIIINPLEPPPYYAYFPGKVDENGDTIKIQMSQYLGPAIGFQLLEYGIRFDTGEYPGGVPVPIYEIYCYMDKNGNLIAVDANGKPLDSPPQVVKSTTGDPPYMAFYPGVVDENGDLHMFPVYSYQPALEDIYTYTDSEGKLIVVDANGKPLDFQPVINDPLGPPPHYATYPGLVDENGDPISVEVPAYKGSLENIYTYTDSQGNLIVVGADGKPIDSPPIISNPLGLPPHFATYPGLVDENGNPISVEIKPYTDSFQFFTYNEWCNVDGEWFSMEVDINNNKIDYQPPDVYYHQDSQGKLTVVDANGKPLNSQPIILSTDGIPPYYYTYPGVVDRAGNIFKLELPPYIPPSAANPATQPD